MIMRQSRIEEVLRWEGFVEKVGFEHWVKEWRSDGWVTVVMMTEMSWQVNEEVSRDMTGEADGMNQGVDSRDGMMHIWNFLIYFHKIWHTAIVAGITRSSAVAERPRDALCHWICRLPMSIGVCKSLLLFHCNYVCISFRFWNTQRQIIAWPWNLVWESFKVIENGAVQ